MNEHERSELERLKQRQVRLEYELGLLSSQLKTLEQRLEKPEPESRPVIPEPAVPAPLARAEQKSQLPAQLLELRREPSSQRVTTPVVPPVVQAPPTAQPPPIPPVIPSPVVARNAPPAQIHGTIASPRPAIAPLPLPAQEPVQPKSLELRLGTYWLVRIGIVVVLTSLVFFGNLAYQNYISQLGPAGKVCLLYVASTLLLCGGIWWQRKAAKQSLKNYGQVLFAGGLAAVYFTTYAAHYSQHLQIIASPVLDGVLLLAWAGFIAWIADRKKSEVLALFGVGLAYYTSFISRSVGFFTLYSNLVLTLAAVFFLVRNRWATVTFGSLVATYAGYGFWRFFDGDAWHLAAPDQALWSGTWFLMSYWLVFTAGVFLSRERKFAGQNRVTLLTLNNGAFFTMFLLTMLQVREGGFWKFMLIYGSVLLALAIVSFRVLREEPLAMNAYLTQGLLLVTVGLITKFAGLQLALMLAAESVILLMLGQQRKNIVLLTGSYIAAGLAVGWGIDGMRQDEPSGVYLAIGLGALMLGNTLLVHRRIPEPSPALLRPQAAYFTILALLTWLVATWDNTTAEHFPLVLAVEAVALALSVYVLRVREISLLAQPYLLLAQLKWSYDAIFETSPVPWWNPVFMLVLAIAFSQWWQRQKVLDLRSQADPWPALNWVPILAKNLVLLAGMSLAVTLTGGWALALGSQSGAHALYLPIGLGALMLADALLANRPTAAAGQTVLRWQPGYATILALVVWLAVTWHHTAADTFPLVLAAEAVALTASIYVLRLREITLFGQSYLVLAQVAWLLNASQNAAPPPWWNPLLLLAITLGLSHWWQKQKVLQLPRELANLCQGVYALAIIGVLYFWLSPQVGAPTWLALTSLLAVGVTAYGVFTRAWLIAACGQIFVVISAVQFALQLQNAEPPWNFPLAPIAALALLSFATMDWFRRQPEPDARISQPLLQIALVYRWVALVMSLWWICQYIPARERIWLLAFLGVGIFLWAGWRRSREALLFGAVFTVAALVLFWLPLISAPRVYWPNLIAIIALLAQRQAARRFADRYNLPSVVHTTIIIVGGLSLWLFLSRWVREFASGFYLTASWSGLALVLFSVGIALRERMYRWLGLAILGCALGRVIVFDVWKLEQLYRILSLMALGIVLLVLGFIYNKYQDKLKEWL